MKRILLLCGLLLTMWTMIGNGGDVSAETPRADIYDIYESDVVLVEFAATERVRLRQDTVTNLNPARDALKTDALTQQTVGSTWQRANTLDEQTLDQLRADGLANGAADLPDLNNRLRLLLANGLDALTAQAQLGELAIVAQVHLIPKPIPAALNLDYSVAGNNTGNLVTDPYQGYLDAAPAGIDARFAWQIPGGDAFGIKVCDVEYDYNENHADLNDVTFLGDPLISSFGDNHGTAVLGMIGGRDNGFGVRGMAYGASLYFAAANTTTNGYDVGNAVLECAAVLDAGDVILLEQQTAGPNYVPANAPSQDGLVPVEWVKPWHDDIQVAVAQGIIVVEAAGNGGENLDSSTYSTGNGNHHPFLAGSGSGAIIVGAGKSPAFGASARAAQDFSNYGSTVDLQGWGDGIVTTGYGNLHSAEGQNLWYSRSFGGTSGASPMVTSAAAILQAVYQEENGTPASPSQIRSILRDTGTPQLGTNNIGPLPDLRAAINSISASNPVQPPIVTPGAGTYAMPLQATINYASGQNSSNTHIRYTLNGSEPTFSSFIFLPSQGDTLYLNYGVTVKAKAFRVGGGESESATVSYSSSTPQVAAPTISPSAGTYNQGTQLILSTTTPGATIRYRTDGRTPSFFYEGTIYSGPVTLPAGEHDIAARAYKDGFYKSDTVRSGPIVINETVLPSPVVYPNGGEFNGSVNVYLGSTVLGADIRYTVDGSTPSQSSLQFSEPIFLDETATVKTRVYLAGYTPSPVVSKQFTIIEQAATPTISPPDGTSATGTMQVSMSSPQPGATIRYTTNGAEPTSYSAVYNGPFTLGEGVYTVKARGFLQNAQASDTVSAELTVFDPSLTTVDAVQISPLGGNHTEQVLVTLATDTEFASIYYTINDPQLDQPTTSDTLYTGPFLLQDNPGTPAQDNFIIRAKGFKSGFTASAMAQTSFNLFTTAGQLTPAPAFNKPAGVYINTFTVRIDGFNNPPFDVRQIRFTQDGTDPIVTQSNGVSSPRNVSISKSQTLKAIGTRLGFDNTDVASVEYILICDTPEITAGGVYEGSAEITMSSGTSNAKIYYTTDGSAPTDADTLYDGSFTINQSMPIRAYCTRTNFEASDSVTENFIIENPQSPPSILNQPSASASGNTCDALALSLSATGSAPLTYQWFKDGSVIAGANEPVLELDVLRLGDSGVYTADVSNGGGTITSNQSTLTVTDNGASCSATPTAVSTVQQGTAAARAAALLPTVATLATLALVSLTRKRRRDA